MKVHNMCRLAGWIMLAGLTVSLACTTPTETSKETEPPVPPRDGVLVHISHGPEYSQKVLMGLRMANTMSADRDVLVYFDIKGVEAVLREAGEITKEGFPSAKEQIRSLLDQGVTVFVCPSCLAAAGKTEEDLMDGIELAEKETFFTFTEGRILTIDY